MPANAEGGARAHRVPDQDEWYRAELGADVVEDPAQVGDGRGLLAVPAPDQQAGPEDDRATAPQRMPDGLGDWDHAQHGELNGAGGRGTHGLAAVHHHDDPGDAGGRTAAPRAGKRLAARHSCLPPAPRVRLTGLADIDRADACAGRRTGG